MSKTKNPLKPSRLLKEAKNYLRATPAGPGTRGVCAAVSDAASALMRTGRIGVCDAETTVKGHIISSLCGYKWAEDWLREKANVPILEMKTAGTEWPIRPTARMQQWRLAWIDQMIEHFKAQGR